MRSANLWLRAEKGNIFAIQIEPGFATGSKDGVDARRFHVTETRAYLIDAIADFAHRDASVLNDTRNARGHEIEQYDALLAHAVVDPSVMEIKRQAVEIVRQHDHCSSVRSKRFR